MSTDGGIVIYMPMPPHRPMTDATSGERRAHITQMGAAAHQHLVPGQRGTVLAVMSGIVYLRTASRDILWLASAGIPMHRRCATVGTALPRTMTGAPFLVEECGLRIVPDYMLSTTAASAWEPVQIRLAGVIGYDEIPGRIRALVSTIDLARAQGFGRFIPEIVDNRSESISVADDPVLVHAKPAALGMAESLRSGDRERAALHADALVGLGAGLTPSGDDFLGGMLFGAKALLTAYPDAGWADVALPIDTYRARTNLISLTLLTDHAEGHAIAPLHDIVSGILMGSCAESIRPALGQLLQVGHSTGWDMLVGLIAGLSLAERGSSLRG